jgi:hypothetical protein
MTFIIFGFVWSILVLLILGLVVIRKWLRKRIDLAVWRGHDPHASRGPGVEEEKAIWNGNKEMHMK